MSYLQCDDRMTLSNHFVRTDCFRFDSCRLYIAVFYICFIIFLTKTENTFVSAVIIMSNLI